MASKTKDTAPAVKTAPASKGLQIGEPNDAYEREADHVADLIAVGEGPQWSLSKMGISAPLQRKCACGGETSSGGECEECKSNRILQRKSEGGLASKESPRIVHDVLTMQGRPLDLNIRAYFEAKLFTDLSKVRIHNDAKAAASARAVNASAYTVGNHVVFDTGLYSPQTYDGRKLLAHELAHTLQQSQVQSAASTSLPIGETNDLFEGHASAVAKDAMSSAQSGETEPPVSSIPKLTRLRVQRAPPTISATNDYSAIIAHLESIIRSGPVDDQTRVIGAAVVEVPGYKGSTEIRAISSAATDDLGHDAAVHHAESPSSRTLSATRTISGGASRKEFPFSHINDAEIKMFEEIKANLPEGAEGTVHFLTMRARRVNGSIIFEPMPACSGCTRATFEMAANRGINIVSHSATHPTGSLDMSQQAPAKPPPSGPEGANGSEEAAPPSKPGAQGTSSSLAGETPAEVQKPPASAGTAHEPAEGVAKAPGAVETPPASAPVGEAEPVPMKGAKGLTLTSESGTEQQMPKAGGGATLLLSGFSLLLMLARFIPDPLAQEEQKTISNAFNKALSQPQWVDRTKTLQPQVDQGDGALYYNVNYKTVYNGRHSPSPKFDSQYTFKEIDIVSIDVSSNDISSIGKLDPPERASGQFFWTATSSCIASIRVKSGGEIKREARAKQTAMLLEKRRQTASKSTEAAVPPPEPHQTAPLLNGPGPQQTESAFNPLPGAPGVSPMQEAETVAANFKTKAIALLARGEKLAATSSTSQTEIASFKNDEDTWRTDATLVRNHYADNGPELGRARMEVLLESDQYGGRLNQIRRIFGV